MTKNIHPYERVFRIIGGTFLSSLAFWGPKNKAFLAFLIPVATGAIGSCPLYSALNISTLPASDKSDNDYFPVQSTSERAAGHPIVGVA